MTISLICFSLTGLNTSERLKDGLERLGHEVFLFKKSKYLQDSVKESLENWTERHFSADDGIIFVGACGIAVRSISPYIRGKKTDPAVLVTDECGKFVISLLSGHLGGANELAHAAAEILHGMPVITTATDLHGRFAVDVFAKHNNCGIFFMKAAKEVSAALLAGEKVGFYSEFPWNGRLPEGLVECDSCGFPVAGVNENTGVGDKMPLGIAVTVHTACFPFASTVHVVPPVLTLGMGCRKGMEASSIERAALECLERGKVYRQALEKLSSIDLKKEEKGFLLLAQKWELPFVTFSEKKLAEIPGDFTPSSFVKSVTGVDNVCERSAVAGAGQGKLAEKKYGSQGVTSALAVRKWEVQFE